MSSPEVTPFIQNRLHWWKHAWNSILGIAYSVGFARHLETLFFSRGIWFLEMGKIRKRRDLEHMLVDLWNIIFSHRLLHKMNWMMRSIVMVELPLTGLFCTFSVEQPAYHSHCNISHLIWHISLTNQRHPKNKFCYARTKFTLARLNRFHIYRHNETDPEILYKLCPWVKSNWNGNKIDLFLIILIKCSTTLAMLDVWNKAFLVTGVNCPHNLCHQQGGRGENVL